MFRPKLAEKENANSMKSGSDSMKRNWILPRIILEEISDKTKRSNISHQSDDTKQHSAPRGDTFLCLHHQTFIKWNALERNNELSLDKNLIFTQDPPLQARIPE